MTIDEAIKHCLEEAGELQKRADSAELIDILDGFDVESCKECAADHRQLAEWLTELKKAKRLLKAAVEDMEDIVSSDSGCRCCKGEEAASCAYIKCWTWRYADRALALLGKDIDVPATERKRIKQEGVEQK